MSTSYIVYYTDASLFGRLKSEAEYVCRLSTDTQFPRRGKSLTVVRITCDEITGINSIADMDKYGLVSRVSDDILIKNLKKNLSITHMEYEPDYR